MQDLRGEAKTCVPISLCPVTRPYWLPVLGDPSDGPCGLRLEAGRRVGYPQGRQERGVSKHPVEEDGSGGSSRVSSKGRKMVWSRGWGINTVRCL